MSTELWITMWVLLTLFVFLPAVVFLLTGMMYMSTIKRNKDGKASEPFINNKSYTASPIKQLAKQGKEYMQSTTKEEITITSFDNTKLVGYYFPAPGKTDKILIGMHGFKSSPYNGYSPFIKFYHSLGYSLIIPYQRAHGKSEGKYVTMGVKERLDCLCWVNYAVDRFGSDLEILLHGVSMGGATVCAVSGENLPPQVKGIISDCAYSSLTDEVTHQLKTAIKLPKFPFLKYCELIAKTFADFDYTSYTPVDQVKKAKVPMLFVHGKEDNIVPVNCCKKLYENCASKKQILLVENANHAESFAVENELYKKTIIDFFNIK